MIPEAAIHPKITLGNNKPTPIQHYDCHQAHRTLGQYKAPNSNQDTHLQYLLKKSNVWLVAIQEANLTRQEAQAAYEMIWFPSISYG